MLDLISKVHAQPPPTPGPGSGTSGGTTGMLDRIGLIFVGENEGFLQVIGRVVDWLLVLAGVIAVVYLVYGGLLYITAGGDSEKATKGRTAVINAIIGIIIILLAIVIVSWVTGIVRTGTA
jgi:hypothetical protein